MYTRITETLNRLNVEKEKINEETTKQTLIMPLIQQLGYDIFDHKKLELEYNADMRSKGGERVDYAIKLGGKPVIFIEVKQLGTPLEEHIGQLQRYYSANNDVRYGVLTDGREYWFFADDEYKNKMDTEPFYKLDIFLLKREDKDFLDLFNKDRVGYLEGERRKFALSHYYRENIENPSKSFLEFLSKGLGYEVYESDIISIRRTNKIKDEEKAVCVGVKEEGTEIEGVELSKGLAGVEEEVDVGAEVVELKEEVKEDVVVGEETVEEETVEEIEEGVRDETVVEDEQVVLAEAGEEEVKEEGNPEGYIVLGELHEFETWKEVLFQVVNTIAQQKGGIRGIKEVMPNRATFGIQVNARNTYNYKKLSTGEYLYVNLSKIEMKNIINIVLENFKSGETIEYI